MPVQSSVSRHACSLARRCCAIFYDLLLLLSVLFFATLVIIPFNGGKPVDHGNVPYNVYLLSITYLYFTWQWTYGGQTLGMRAWKIRLFQPGAAGVSWRNATLRFLLAVISVLVLGGGFLWSLFDPDHLAFHDRYSNTRLEME